VLGLGNLLLSDDAAGLHLEAALKEERGASPRVEFVDGGTQGLALLDYLSNGRAVLVLAVARLLGDEAAEIVVIGVEPAVIATGIGLSPEVTASLPKAMERARAVLDSMLRR
jgi:hydrogenase maturation protease